MIICDELFSAVETGLIDAARAQEYIERWLKGAEVVATGRNAPENLLALADYVTQMRKIKHPFDRGLPPGAVWSFKERFPPPAMGGGWKQNPNPYFRKRIPPFSPHGWALFRAFCATVLLARLLRIIARGFQAIYLFSFHALA